MIKVYENIHFQWVLNNFRTHKDSVEMAKLFQLEFNIPMTAQKMRGLWKRLDLRKNNQHKYTKEQDAWLIKNHETKSFSKLTKDFNDSFNCNVTKKGIEQRCYQRLKLRYIDRERFNNKIAWNKKNIGEEHTDPKGNIYIKSDNEKWILKARYIYEKYIGKVEKGYQIIQLDGNKNNFDLNNLAKVHTKNMIMLNRNKWLGKGEISKTALLYCELHYLKENR